MDEDLSAFCSLARGRQQFSPPPFENKQIHLTPLLHTAQAFGDLRPLHRLLVQIEEKERVVEVMASLTARYMRDIL